VLVPCRVVWPIWPSIGAAQRGKKERDGVGSQARGSLLSRGDSRSAGSWRQGKK
jgi:hypothetical protein